MARFKPEKDGYVLRGDHTLKVLEVHGRGKEVTIRNEYGFHERVSVADLSPPDPEVVARRRKLAAGGSGPRGNNF